MILSADVILRSLPPMPDKAPLVVWPHGKPPVAYSMALPTVQQKIMTEFQLGKMNQMLARKPTNQNTAQLYVFGFKDFEYETNAANS